MDSFLDNEDLPFKRPTSEPQTRNVTLIRPDSVATVPKKKPVQRMPRSKFPENLKDFKKHSDHKPAGGQLVFGTIKSKKKPTAQIIQGPLTGQTFVITGQLKGSTRDEMIDRLRALGGRVTGSVSTKTSCLIHGEQLQDGRHFTLGQKYQKAHQLSKLILDEEGIEDMLGSLFSKRPTSVEPVQLPPRAISSIPWAQKYKPKSIKELVGNSHAVEKLSTWLSDWDDVVLYKNKKDVRPISKGRFDPQYHLNAKAALLSGSPGIGKTSAARLIARGLGYHLTEMNASDVRSRKAILEPLKGISLSNSLTATGKVVKNLIIMDEVDGMSSGDRGGIGAIVQIIKKTSVPIICICNERMGTKLKSLLNNSYDIRFIKPNKPQVLKRLTNICQKEELSLEPNALDFLFESTGGDIRQSLNVLEVWSRQNGSLTYSQAKTTARSSGKDAISMVSNFDAASKLLNSRDSKALRNRQKMDLFFVDMDLLPLLIYQNYLTAIAVDRGACKKMTLACDSIAFSDVINKQIRSKGEWSLLPSFGQASTVEPSYLTGNGVPYPRFPEWLGRFSTSRRNARLLKEVKNAFGGRTSGDVESVLNDYIPIIYHLVMRPLKQRKIDGVPEAVELLYEYGLAPDFLKDHMIALQFGALTFEQEFRDLPSSVKKGLTYHYNAHHKSSIEKKKKKKFDKTGKDKFDPDIDEAPPFVENSESDHEFKVKAKIKKKPKKARRDDQ